MSFTSPVRPTLPRFETLFGRPPEVVAEAPGRVNLMGDHTDYSGGWVLPTTVPLGTRVELARSEGRRVRVWSTVLGPGTPPAEYLLGSEHRRQAWIDYVQGVTWSLAGDGHALGGFDARVSGDLPLGRGLASSAALEIALLRALRVAFRLPLDGAALAAHGRRAENQLVGAPTGVMDQLAVALGEPGAALLLDTRTGESVLLPLPRSLDLVVVDSGVPHDNASGAYARRHDECLRAARLLGVGELRDLEPEEHGRVAALPPPLDRRARHVLAENARVLATAAALRTGDEHALRQLFAASHRSLRDDYEVSIPPVDLLVALLAGERDVIAARMTGAGFGGAVVALVRAGAGAIAAARVTAAYVSSTGRPGRVLVPPAGPPTPGDPVHEETHA